MYKLDFYMAMAPRTNGLRCSHFERVSGWGETLRTPRKEIEFGFAKRDGKWCITETSTGMGLGGQYQYRTRTEALKAIDDELLLKVESALNSERAIRLAEKLRKWAMA